MVVLLLLAICLLIHLAACSSSTASLDSATIATSDVDIVSESPVIESDISEHDLDEASDSTVNPDTSDSEAVEIPSEEKDIHVVFEYVDGTQGDDAAANILTDYYWYLNIQSWQVWSFDSDGVARIYYTELPLPFESASETVLSENIFVEEAISSGLAYDFDGNTLVLHYDTDDTILDLYDKVTDPAIIVDPFAQGCIDEYDGSVYLYETDWTQPNVDISEGWEWDDNAMYLIRLGRKDSAVSATEAAIISGIDSKGNVVWTHATDSYERTELERISEIATLSNQYIYCEGGTIVSLDIQTGDILWKNSEFSGAGLNEASIEVAPNDTIYMCGYYGPDFFAIDAEGHTIAKLELLDEEYYWPASISLIDDQCIAVEFSGGPDGYRELGNGYVFYINLNDFSYYFAGAETDVTQAEMEEQIDTSASISPDALVGDWVIDSNATMETNGESMIDMFGTGFKLGNGMSLGADGSIEYWIGIGYGGEGTWEIVESSILYSINPYEAEELETGTIRIIDDGFDGIRLVFEVGPYDVYWAPV